MARVEQVEGTAEGKERVAMVGLWVNLGATAVVLVVLKVVAVRAANLVVWAAMAATQTVP